MATLKWNYNALRNNRKRSINHIFAWIPSFGIHGDTK